MLSGRVIAAFLPGLTKSPVNSILFADVSGSIKSGVWEQKLHVVPAIEYADAEIWFTFHLDFVESNCFDTGERGAKSEQ